MFANWARAKNDVGSRENFFPQKNQKKSKYPKNIQKTKNAKMPQSQKRQKPKMPKSQKLPRLK